jgi:acyl-CoA dehydrogenase
MKSQDTCEFFDNVKVPKKNRLGEERMGFKIMMEELERLTVGIFAVATAEGPLKIPSLTRQKERLLKLRLLDFKTIQTSRMYHPNANTSGFFVAALNLLVDHKLTTETASMIKYSATDTCGSVVDECLQLFGGYGYGITHCTYVC